MWSKSKARVAVLAVLAMALWAGTAVAVTMGPVKWSQPPEGALGLDIPSSAFGAGPWNQWVADDWLCQDGRPISDIHWWGSWFNPPDGVNVFPSFWMFQIYADVPENFEPFSHPGEELWSWTIPFGAVPEQQTDLVGWDDKEVYQYNVNLPVEEWFHQERDQIYWLKIALDFVQAPPNSWGWHTSATHWNDDAVAITWDIDNQIWLYQPLVYPDGHPDEGQTIDMAFELTTVPEPATLLILASGLGVLLARARKRLT